MVEKRYHVNGQGIRFTVRLTPRGGRDAAPEFGKANAALIALPSKTSAIARARTAIVGGETARMKMVQIAGDGVALAAAPESLGDNA